MLTRFYLAPQIGDGFTTPYRSLLNTFIDIIAGDWFDEIDNPGRRISICCVHASQIAHDACVADVNVIPLSPLYADESELGPGLDTLLNSIPGAATIKARLEANGISMSWVTGTDTLRKALKYLVFLFFFSQVCDGRGLRTVRDFVKNNLDTPVSAIAPDVRNDVAAWMQGMGWDTSWIVGTTTVREVLHFIISNIRFKEIIMSGEII